jgi:hypothetical protein
VLLLLLLPLPELMQKCLHFLLLLLLRLGCLAL